MKKIFLFVLFAIATHLAFGGILPTEGAVLHYRIIGFSFPEAKKTGGSYSLEVATGTINEPDSFIAKKIFSKPCTSDRLIVEVPKFGESYTWRVVQTGKKANKQASPLHHFSTSTIPYVDTSLNRIRVVEQSEKYADNYFFADCFKALYDMNGMPVWYLPAIEGSDFLCRDIKITPQGTLTVLFENLGAYEVNYDGDILWKAPNVGHTGTDNVQGYHHEFTRLDNGHYMLLGNEHTLWQLPAGMTYDTLNYRVARKDNNYYQKIDFATLIEYDESGKVVWSWRSSDYFKKSDLAAHRTSDGFFDIENVHGNSFYFDEKNKMIYCGFRNISRVVKINYADGAVVAEYGKKYRVGETVEKGYLFCNQHCCRQSANGDLYLCDNNDCNFPAPPSILKLRESAQSGGELQKTWEYRCPKAETTPGKIKRPKNGGGSVYELPDHSVFACVNYLYTSLFIADAKKNIWWRAFSETYNAVDKTWNPSYQYRASMITSKQLESLIWNAEKKQTGPKSASESQK